MPGANGRVLHPVVLVILDGFGLRSSSLHNAVALADAPTIKRIFAHSPWMRLDPSGEAVGLPRHQMGTSEVGHLNLGAGRVVDQELVRINKAIADGSFFENTALLDAMRAAKRPGAALHLLGLCSDGGVHSQLTHLFALLELAHRERVQHVFIHAITDGRDTKPRVAAKYLAAIEQTCRAIGVGEIATVAGRYYAMDRDNRWEREQLAYDCLTRDSKFHATTAAEAVKAGYGRGESDEFLSPTIVATKDSRTGRIIDGDSVIFFNFRQDRARQLTHGFTDAAFSLFKRKKLRLTFTTFTCYDARLKVRVVFPPDDVKNCLAEWLAAHRIRQFHVAETEKYAHVTYFFNGGREPPFRGEERVLVPSPRVATYDLQPEMSAAGVCDNLVAAIRSKLYGFSVANFANADMVGHTGKLDAAIKAIEAIDRCLARIEAEARLHDVVLLIVADHGNAEEMAGKYQTSHTLNNVPFILVDGNLRFDLVDRKRIGKLADVAPTILALLGLPAPPEMTGEVLVRPVEMRAEKARKT